MMASRHGELLKQYCRLCGTKTAIADNRNPYKKEAFERTIQEALHIDTKEEDGDVFPPFICLTCERKLARFKLLKRKKKVFTVNIPLREFKQHDDTCEMCKEVDGIAPTPNVVKAGMEAAEEYGLSFSKQHDRILIFSVIVKEHNVCVPKSIAIFEDRTWEVAFVGKKVAPSANILHGIPLLLDEESVKGLVRSVAESKVCVGNKDFVDFLKNKNIRGYVVDTNSEETVRSINCKLVAEDNGKCSVCSIQRSDLLSMKNRNRLSSPMKARVSSKAKLQSLSKKQLISRARNIQKDRMKVKSSQRRLQDKIRKMFREESVPVGDTEEIEKMVKGAAGVIEENLVDKSAQKLLWEEQTKALKTGDRRQMRWHPSVIRWAIAVHSKSPAAYKLIKDSKFLILPAIGTLTKYTHYTQPKTGVHHDMIQQTIKEMNLKHEFQRNVSLICDEMKTKSGIVYSSSTGELIGFVDVGSINNELRAFEKRLKEDTDELASHAFMIMVRGLFSPAKQAVALFPTSSLRSGEIYDCVMKTVLAVETAGLKVRVVVADGASCNRKFFRICTDDVHGYYTINPADQDRKIYFFCDVPHLLKTARNNLENSGFNRKSRNLQFGEKHMRWTHLIQLYEWDCTSDLRLLPRLSHEHLYLNPSLRMRVKLATQVLSKSVANALKLRSDNTGDTSTDGTRQFVEMFNKFFDCLNVSTASEGQRKRNPNLLPYRDVDDSRFEWLRDVFLQYLSDWEKAIADSPNLSAIERERRCISKETRDGLRITVNSFVELTKELLVEEGVQYVLSEKFSQDPIEEYFSKQRGAGGSNDNPTIQQVANNMLTLQVAGAAVKASKYGNVTKSDGTDDVQGLPLPKRKRHVGNMEHGSKKRK
ncbi:uncharacterized protein LOC100893587 [Strongylocentrotus purpuratus]|uniref:Uncharacterized protein n=1 Tax=Strongylocentrotus purpuratus TaxID=7668 RepID=A0A7M7HIQ9_STRPU|nr:uncharacterized protein LOC100893587 [Strongylocentrotus purpuratus]|eukprot:XP_011680559.1 PREDICTED: uncharacterized protein LOC100893587 [Strongylocentrotus purpuratus]